MDALNTRAMRTVIGSCLLVIVLGIFWPRESKRSASGNGAGGEPNTPSRKASIPSVGNHQADRPRRMRAPEANAEQIVASKVQQFARSRREIMRALAQRNKIKVPDSVERFFDALETGNWEEITARFNAINGGDSSASSGAPNRPPGIEPLWPAIIDAFGAAQQAHLWPAQKLLDYGYAILDSLRPGMVYVGGTDEGRWVPSLLNDTSEGERHIVVTQNGLADKMYLDYVNFLYGDQIVTLNESDGQRAFENYVNDAVRRQQHDEQFPNEPKQIRPNEDVKSDNGRVQVSGATAVFAINEKLLEVFMEKNPNLSFAIQESRPFRSTYAEATPLGPIMELRAGKEQSGLTAERAAQSVEYWRSTADRLLADPEAAGSSTSLASFSKLAVGQANLFAERNFTTEAEQAYRIAFEIQPANPEAVTGLSELLTRAGRGREAAQVLETFVGKNPNQRSAIEEFRRRQQR